MTTDCEVSYGSRHLIEVMTAVGGGESLVARGIGPRGDVVTDGKPAVRALSDHNRQKMRLSCWPLARVHPPQPSLEIVLRSRLHHLLSRSAAEADLTLITAPPGSGKTVLAAEWATRQRATGPLAWLTVDEADDRPELFWTHLQRSVRTALGGPLTVLPPSSIQRGPDPVDSVAELLDGDRPIVLVIDEAQRLTSLRTWRDLNLLIRAAGHSLHVVMTTRRQPPLPLYRYRLEGTIAEVRAEQLAFTANEVRSLLEASGVETSASTVATVMRHTEGWAAGVRFGAMALQNLPTAVSPEECLRTMLGPGNTLVAEYLEAEVLAELPHADQEFLTRVSLLDRVDPDLAREITGRTDAGVVLDALARRTGFVLRRQWPRTHYELHPLLREVLARRLAARPPDRIRRLQRRTAAWLATEGRVPEAIAQAFAADDEELAAQIVVDSAWVGNLLLPTSDGRVAAARFAACQDEIGSSRVKAVRAATSLGRGDLARAREEVAIAESHADEGDAALTLVLAVLGTRLALAAGDPGATLAAANRAREALQAVTMREEADRGLLASLVGLAEGTAFLLAGDRPRACTMLADALAGSATADLVAPRLDCLSMMALAETSLGRLRRARALIQTLDRLVIDNDIPQAERPVAAQLARVWAALERQDLPTAEDCLTPTTAVAGVHDDALLGPVWTLLRARLLRDRGDAGAARRLLAGRSAGPTWLLELGDAEARALGMLTAQGGDPNEQRVPPSVPPSISQQVERLLGQAERRSARGDYRAGRAHVLRAITLARSEDIRRPFRHIQPRVMAMVEVEPSLAGQARWLRQGRGDSTGQLASEVSSPAITAELTKRELEVLRHLAELLTTDEIAATMFVSNNTVRTHVRNILAKLSVSRRNDAVRRARELSIV